MIPGLGRFPREGNDNPLQYSCLENPMDRTAWRAIVQGVHKESDMTKQYTLSLSKFAEDMECSMKSVTKSGLKFTSDSQARAVICSQLYGQPQGSSGRAWSLLQGVVPPWVALPTPGVAAQPPCCSSPREAR